MRILHTADWHIGQLFYNYDRAAEHGQFLDWLLATIQLHEVDVLLVSGDVFDISNPSAASVRLFYTFLKQASAQQPNLQIIVTAGNHDSASRLEMPKPLLESSSIHIIGLIERNADGDIDYEKLLIPLSDRSGKRIAWCMAVPFLRMGDYPSDSQKENTYASGVTLFYEQLYQAACNLKQPDEALICMGHLHTQQAEITDMDHHERMIMGGVEMIPASAFPPAIDYVALGHIHKAQMIGGQAHIRYCGSPIPLSFSELRYPHQVVLIDMHPGEDIRIQTLDIPLFTQLLRLPATHQPIEKVLDTLAQLPKGEQSNAPYLEVRVLLHEPEPGLRHAIEQVLADKQVRLAKIDVQYPDAGKKNSSPEPLSAEHIQELQPQDIFRTLYTKTYASEVPEPLMQLFQQVVQQVNQDDIG